MSRKITFDIESNYLLNEDGIDYTSFPYKLKDDYKIHCIVAQDIDTEEIFEFIQEDCVKFITFLKEECTYIAQYNGIDFDLMLLRLYFGMEYQIQPHAHKRLKMSDPYEALPDRLEGKKVRFIDLMILSKVLNPDRFPGHALADHGKRLKYYKGDYGKKEEAWAEYSEKMLTYCIRDVKLTTKVYQDLIKEIGDYKDWRESYDLEMCVRDFVSSTSQHLGFKLDKDLAEWCVIDLKNKMKEIENKVEPKLPKRSLPKGAQLELPKVLWKRAFDYNKPFTQTGLKKSVKDYLSLINIPENMQLDYICSMLGRDEDGNVINYIEKELLKHESLLSATALNFCSEKLGINIEKDSRFAFSKIISLEAGEELPELKEKMKLSHKADVKKYLVEQGWEPTTFNDRDLTLDSNKRKRNKEDFITAVERYVEDTLNGVYCKFRCDHLKVKPENLKEFLLNKKRNKPIKVITTPKYTKNQEKDLCDGLVALGSKFDYVKDIVSWLTYDHRLNTIKSPKGTGWLNEKRLEQDGHISTPADTLGAITGRFTHRKIVNCPRVTSLYGEYMRGMLCVDDWAYELGFDADGLEARMEAAFVYKYPGGPEYVEKLIGVKPNDIHTLNAKKFGIDRDSVKTLKYSLSYGAQAPKVAQQQGWTIQKAQKIVSQYWGEAKPAKLLIEAIERHWEQNNKLFVIGLDKRKLFCRAKHTLLNLILQNAGLVCMKRSHVILERWLREENLLGDPFKDDLSITPKATPIIVMHDELQQSVHKNLVRIKYFKTKDEAKEYKKKIEGEGKFILSDVGKGFEENHTDEYFVGWSRVGELTVKSLLAAGEYYNLPIKLTSGYQIGRSWKDCH